MTPFENYLIQKGWRRYKKNFSGNNVVKEYSNSDFVSSMGILGYFFEHSDYPEIQPYWGLDILGMPPVMILVDDLNYRYCTDFNCNVNSLATRIIKSFHFDLIYEKMITGKLIDLYEALKQNS